MTEELLRLRRTTAMLMACDSIVVEPIVWVRDVMKGDVLLWMGIEAEVTGITNIRDKADIVECQFELAVETKTRGQLRGVDSGPLKANHLMRVIRFAGETL